MNISRRWFIGGLSSFGAFGGCRMFCDPTGTYASGKPRVSFGVVSDIHFAINAKGNGLYESHNAATFIHALEWFRDQGVDGVMVAGDMADMGTVLELQGVADAWYKVFPNDKAPDGRKVEKLFVMGNHDWEGCFYGDRIKKIWPDKEAFARNVIRTDMKGNWERIFNEPYAPIYRKEINGYAFVGAHWTQFGCRGRNEQGIAGVEEYFAANGGKIDPSLPFFYFQHPHPQHSCHGNTVWGQDDGRATRALTPFSNAIAFSGHSHNSLTDEKAIWQGAFTSLGTSSLRYTAVSARPEVPYGYEDGNSVAKFDPYKAMGHFSGGDGRQGYLVRVYDDCVTFSRRDFVYDQSLGADWVLPLPAAESKPFAHTARAAKAKAPGFAPDAALTVKKIRGKNRGSRAKDGVNVPKVEKDVFKVSWPAALAVAGARPYAYEVTVETKDGKKNVHYVTASGFNMATEHKKAQARTVCTLACDRLPEGEFRFCVAPLDSFNTKGAALTSAWVSTKG